MVSVVFSKNNRPKTKNCTTEGHKKSKILRSGEYPPEAAAPYHAKSSAAGNLSNDDQFSTVKTSVAESLGADSSV